MNPWMLASIGLGAMVFILLREKTDQAGDKEPTRYNLGGGEESDSRYAMDYQDERMKRLVFPMTAVELAANAPIDIALGGAL